MLKAEYRILIGHNLFNIIYTTAEMASNRLFYNCQGSQAIYQGPAQSQSQLLMIMISLGSFVLVKDDMIYPEYRSTVH